jgi:imidazolonepropionase-like amidohydrolase
VVLGGAGVVALTASGVAQQRPAAGAERQWVWPTTVEAAPDRPPGEGEGPFDRLVIRGATMIDGTGAPADGPVDIVIEKNRIADIRVVGVPGVPIRQSNRPGGATREIDASGMYVLPGFIDLHAHIGRPATGAPAEFVYKLWLAHGVTTIREPGSFNGIDWTLRERERSARNAIVAPRIFAYVEPSLGQVPAGVGKGGAVPSFLPSTAGGAVAGTALKGDAPPPLTPDGMARYVAWADQKGVDGFKLLTTLDPEIVAPLLKGAEKHHLGSMAHLGQMGVYRLDAVIAARLGLGSLEHWYGLPEALFDNQAIQALPANYNYADESQRFAESGRVWSQAARPGSEKWNRVMNELLERHLVLDPTMTAYEKARDTSRDMHLEWFDTYLLPSQWRAWMPNRELHGAYFVNWTTADEIAWKKNFVLWMAFLNEYKNRGGRVTVGSDSAGPFEQFGFEYIRELELLQEAGFNPLEVVRAATMLAAQTLYEPKEKPIEFGILRPGLLADLVIVPLNPLANLKVLYATGTMRLNDQTGEIERVGGVKYVIKDGILYDAKKLLADVAGIVAEARKKVSATGPAPQAGSRW